MRVAVIDAGPIPDSRGINLYRADRDAAPLFAHYLPTDLFRHLVPHFDRLGALAGGRLDELASIATATRRPLACAAAVVRIPAASRSIRPM